MTLKEIADAASVSESTVRRWVKQGALPAYRLGRQFRFDPDDFQRFLERQRLEGTDGDRRSEENYEVGENLGTDE